MGSWCCTASKAWEKSTRILSVRQFKIFPKILVPLPEKEGRELMIRKFLPEDRTQDFDYENMAGKTEVLIIHTHGRLITASSSSSRIIQVRILNLCARRRPWNQFEELWNWSRTQILKMIIAKVHAENSHNSPKWVVSVFSGARQDYRKWFHRIIRAYQTFICSCNGQISEMGKGVRFVVMNIPNSP